MVATVGLASEAELLSLGQSNSFHPNTSVTKGVHVKVPREREANL
jgi:hypothetical protein